MKGKIMAAGELRMEEGYEITGVLVEVTREELQAHVGNLLYQEVVITKHEPAPEKKGKEE